MDEPVAAKDRISVDISDIKDRIETYRLDPAWRELSFAGKIRALVIEKLEENDHQTSQQLREGRSHG
jgi:predicted ribonuclease toxin of YeeF-YezG toxin-antitoxin module